MTPDPSGNTWNRTQGTHAGAKLVAEWYSRLDHGFIATAAAGFSTADMTGTVRATFAKQIAYDIELGVEAAAFTDELSQDARAGMFVVLPALGRFFRLAAGWRWSDDSDPGPYGTFSLYMPY